MTPPRARHILVLFHAQSAERAWRSSVVHYLAPYWREAGHRVTFWAGVRGAPTADLVFVHVDLSVVPDDYLELAARYPAAVNASIRDIRKSRVSQILVRPGDGWDGPVIAKSDLNYAGRPERGLGLLRAMLRRKRMGRTLLRAWERHGWLAPPFRSWRDYRVFEHPGQIPRALREDARVVVERFLPERDGALYCIRNYQFLGDRETCVRLASPDPLVKAENSVRVERIEVPAQARVWRERFQLDYGKLDFVLHQGEPVLLDVNKTTGADGFAPGPELEERRRFRAAGIESLFRD